MASRSTHRRRRADRFPRGSWSKTWTPPRIMQQQARLRRSRACATARRPRRIIRIDAVGAPCSRRPSRLPAAAALTTVPWQLPRPACPRERPANPMSALAGDPRVPRPEQIMDDQPGGWTARRSIFQGILLKPRGHGPFPAVVFSHGYGGNARWLWTRARRRDALDGASAASRRTCARPRGPLGARGTLLGEAPSPGEYGCRAPRCGCRTRPGTAWATST